MWCSTRRRSPRTSLGCTVCCTSDVTSPTPSCAIQVATSGYKPKPSRSYAPARIRGLAPSRTCRPSFGSG
jgi:hypothetical protein